MDFTVNFNDVAYVLENYIDETITALQNGNIIKQDIIDPQSGTIKDKPYKIRYFINDGEYHKYIKIPNNIKDSVYPEILFLIKDNGIIQDPTTNGLQTYLQKIRFEIYCFNDEKNEYRYQLQDLEQIIASFAYTYKSKTDTVDDNDFILNVSENYTISQLENKHAVITLNLNMTIIANAHLANKDILKINGYEVPYITLVTNTHSDVTFDNRKQEVATCFVNRLTQQISVTGIAINNTIINQIIEKCDKAIISDDPYTIEIMRKNEIINDSGLTYVIQDVQNIRQFGQIIGWKATFYPYWTRSEY